MRQRAAIPIRGMATIRDKMGHCLHDSLTPDRHAQHAAVGRDHQVVAQPCERDHGPPSVDLDEPLEVWGPEPDQPIPAAGRDHPPPRRLVEGEYGDGPSVSLGPLSKGRGPAAKQLAPFIPAEHIRHATDDSPGETLDVGPTAPSDPGV